VLVEDVRPLGADYDIRVRHADGDLEGAVLSALEFEALLADIGAEVAILGDGDGLAETGGG
jgi:hypothetical protein